MQQYFQLRAIHIHAWGPRNPPLAGETVFMFAESLWKGWVTGAHLKASIFEKMQPCHYIVCYVYAVVDQNFRAQRKCNSIEFLMRTENCSYIRLYPDKKPEVQKYSGKNGKPAQKRIKCHRKECRQRMFESSIKIVSESSTLQHLVSWGIASSATGLWKG